MDPAGKGDTPDGEDVVDDPIDARENVEDKDVDDPKDPPEDAGVDDVTTLTSGVHGSYYWAIVVVVASIGAACSHS